MVDLTREKKEKILKGVLRNIFVVNKIKINNNDYFVKVADSHDDGMELVVEHIATDLGIKCAHYDLTMINGIDIYLTEDLEDKGTFITGKQLFISKVSHSLGKIFDTFLALYPLDSKDLFSELIRVYLLDIFLMHEDRHLGNWGLLEINNRPELYILDNAKAFLNKTQTYLRAKEDRYYETIYKRYDDPDDIIINLNMGDLEYFINNYSDEYIGYLIDMYYVLTPSYIKSIFEKVKHETNKSYFRFSEEYLRMYEINYQKIGDLLRKYNLVSDTPRIKEK